MKSNLVFLSFHTKAVPFRQLIKVIVFLLLFILSFFQSYAQQPTQEWVARIPGPYNDVYGPYLSVDKQGNSYVAGTHVVNDTINILCVKYNTAGVQQWSTLYKYPGYGYFVPTGLAIDTTGNAYVISGIALNSLTPRNMLIVKFNSLTGSAVWGKTYFGQYSQSSFFDIKIDRLNNIYVVGSSDSSHLIIRYNTNGDTVWVRKYHPPWLTAEYLRKCTIDDSLNIVFTGQRRFYYPPFGWYDSLLVAKYSSNGDMRWESVYAYNLLGSDIGTKITSDQNGNSYIGGITTISGDPVYLTIKYDRNGIRQWAKIYDTPGSGNNLLSGIVVDKFNNYLFVSGTNGTRKSTTIRYNISTGDSDWVNQDTGTYSSSNSNDLIVDTLGNSYFTGSTFNYPPTVGAFMTIKYSIMGNRKWMITYAEQGRGIQIKNDIANNLYVLGVTIGDYVLIKYNQIVGINSMNSEIPINYKLEQNYPNPFNPQTKINFHIPKLSSVNITIYDILGRALESPVNEMLKPGVYEISINSTNYSSGTYFYRMTANGNIIDTKKFIVLK